MNRIRVLVVDNYGPWRAAVNKMLSSEPDFEIVAEAVDGFEAIQRVTALCPDVVLMDIGLPAMNGLEAGRRIREISPATKILFFTPLRSPDIAARALEIGGSGYVLKASAAGELIPAIRSVYAGRRFVSEHVPDRDRLVEMAGGASDRSVMETNPFTEFGHNPAIQEFLTSAIDVTEADFGDLHLFDSARSCLKIVAHRGFASEFLKFFEAVDASFDCACAWAMKTRQRVVVADVPTDPLFSAEARDVLLQARVRSLQSTPLIRPRKRFLGVVSTHYARRGGPVPDVLPKLDDLAAEFLANIGS